MLVAPPVVRDVVPVTAGVMVAPADAFEGCCMNANFVAVGGGVPPPPALIVKLLLVAPVSPGLLAARV